MVILGIDPGIAIMGYGIIETDLRKIKPVDFGVIRTGADMPTQERLARIFDALGELIKKYRPDEMAVEELFYFKNQKTVIPVAQTRGVVLLSAQRHGITAGEYTPLQVKQSVVGYGRADKNQVIYMTQMLLDLTERPKPDDAADALAIAICHAHNITSGLRGLK